ncbi:MAG: hypothetical protein NTW08_05670 [Gammaproteobacteria bacterium]|nr:hypothetical protein [Gammaproteobacteria bacterium]
MFKSSHRFFHYKPASGYVNYADPTQLTWPHRQHSSTVRAARHDPSTVAKRQSDHTIFTRTYEDRQLENGARILSPWTQKSSRHSQKMHITTYNTTMRGRKRGPGEFDYNNGLKLNEIDLADYYDRTEENGYIVGRAAIDSAIVNVLEAPTSGDVIGLAQFQRGLDRACANLYKIEDVNTWGALTISNRNLLPQGLIKKPHSPFKGKMKDLDERIVIFKIPGYLTPFTTLHLPHGDPQQALELYAEYKKERIFRCIEKGRLTGTQVDAGDYNRKPEAINQAISSAIENIFPADLKIKTKCKILYNEFGHRRADGSNSTVDASVTTGFWLQPCQLERAQAFIADYREKQAAVVESPQMRL